ncbi:hypothetical protein ACFXOD_37640 [Streptomyces sp. NPDC059161]|uniref:hypothetical protein n=1 Tax=Streptomyces sp. NPDC059161 TaxID=3346749 RepID=UPI0036BD236C
MAATNDYVRRHGNRGWADTTLCATGEPCSMCMSAMAWANLRRVVWGSSIDEIRCTGIGQIALSAREVAASASSVYPPGPVARRSAVGLHGPPVPRGPTAVSEGLEHVLGQRALWVRDSGRRGRGSCPPRAHAGAGNLTRAWPMAGPVVTPTGFGDHHGVRHRRSSVAFRPALLLRRGRGG